LLFPKINQTSIGVIGRFRPDGRAGMLHFRNNAPEFLSRFQRVIKKRSWGFLLQPRMECGLISEGVWLSALSLM